ncbi:MAG: hypothetical protein ACFCVD_04685 [Nodosilinea sp.]
MTQTLTIQIPENLYIPLQTLAYQVGKTPEEFTLLWLTAVIQQFEDDPVEAFIGSVDSGMPDWTQENNGETKSH